ncbi:MAG: DNA mismatch repair endonuclease MutL [Bacteroidetes bacterium]|nr:DNA mismatch repair endonuclease MutL [Bacteroidota bacterium]
MPDIIHLLPDSVANQIAAGEVIQRPASAVKELLENAVDAGADDIKLVIKNAGKTLIQVIDNGCGMSETDARMSFERHATSKIKDAADLFAIHTLGFRGEALASIAAIAQVELKTRRIEDETGTCIQVESTKVTNQEVCACTAGTSIAIKNLFYNIPARRKFLKSDTTELRHIIDEFQRVALVRPEIRFSFFNDTRPLYDLPVSNLKQRIVSLFGSTYNNRLIPLELQSDIVNISGFIGKPEFARKTRGEQFFFANGRYIRHAYLNHAVDAAFKELIPNDAFPTYFIYFSINPDEIDINIHPTKTEINFQNNQVVYAMLSSAIKQTLGKFNITPTLDFDAEQSHEIPVFSKDQPVIKPEIKVNPGYNPFESSDRFQKEQLNFKTRSESDKSWEPLYQTDPLSGPRPPESNQQRTMDQSEDPSDDQSDIGFTLGKNFIVTKVKSGLMVIHMQRAMERILFEEFLASLKSGKGISQQTLFPVTLQFTPQETAIIKELQTDLRYLGFDMEDFGENSFILNGTPSGLNNNDMKDVLDNIIENYKQQSAGAAVQKTVNLAKTMAVNMAGRHAYRMEPEEVNALIDRLFATKAPEISPDGKAVVRIIGLNEIEDKF